MLHQDWLIELGRHLERLRRLETDMDDVREDVDDIRSMIQRVTLLAMLWGGAVLLLLSNEKVAEIVLTVLRLRGG